MAFVIPCTYVYPLLFIYLFFCLFIPPHYYLRYAIAKDTNIVLYMSSQLGYTFRKKGKNLTTPINAVNT